MIRTILTVISLVLFCLLSLVIFAVGWLIGLFSKDVRDRLFFRSVQLYCRFLLLLSGARIQWIGLDKIPQDGPKVYIMNHRSLFDVPLTFALMPGPVRYVAKKEFEKTPLLSWWVKALHCYFIDRDNVREALKTILAGIEDLKNGESVAVFPEGTRGRNEDEREMLKFHEGTFKLATKSGAVIVPITISGASSILEEQFPRIKSRHVTVEVGDPIDPAALSGEEKKFTGRYVRGIMMETMQRNHESLRRIGSTQ